MNKGTLRTANILLLAGLFAAALAGCDKDPRQTLSVTPVTYLTVKNQPVTLTRELPGRVSAFRVSEVRPQVGGIILDRLFEEGKDVLAGQVLYQIDPSLYQTAYNNARANLSRAQATLVSARLLAQRHGTLVKVNAISKQEHDDAVAAHGQAKADVEATQEALETARINLGYTKVTAPVSGRIGRSSVTPGALVTQNQPTPLATIQQLSPVHVDVTQSNTELLQLRRALANGQLRSSDADSAKVKLTLEDGSAYARNAMPAANEEKTEWIEGDLLFSDVTIDQSTGAVTIRAKFENPENILLPGMYVRAVLEEGIRENAVLIPQKTVMRDARGRPFVYVLTKEHPDKDARGNKNLAENEHYIALRSIAIGRDHQNNWLVNSGLQAGDLLLVDGQQKVRPGQRVSGTMVAHAPSSSEHVPATGEGR